MQVDESGQKVRPIAKRCTIILREIPESVDENVGKIFPICFFFALLTFFLKKYELLKIIFAFIYLIFLIFTYSKCL